MPAIFAVGDEPYCLWEIDVGSRTKDFLDGFDPEFFRYLLDCFADPKDEADQKRASVATRLALHHATETLFSLLGAFVQAPLCPYAWIPQCRTDELRAVVARIGAGDPTLIAGWKRPFTGWEDVSSIVHRHLEPGSERQKRVIAGFAMTWARLAGDFLDDAVNDEYNAIKHGFRTRAGGFRLDIGREDAYGVPPPESEMVTIGQSKFGSMFYRVQRHKDRGGRHLTSRRTSMNWSIERDTLLLDLAQFSINNVISALKVENGTPADTVSMQFPADGEDYGKPWASGPGLISANFDTQVDVSRLPTVTRKDILGRLRSRASTPI